MEQPNKKHRKDKKYPRVPIKTYKWEDIRRDRRRGGYPWTYLYKQPFNEELDSESFTMEALRKSKSASTLSTLEGVEISEITGESTKGSFGKFLELPEKMETLETLQIITEPDDHSIKNSTGSIVIEECGMSENGSHKPENVTLESADSSDNISQYLDKDEGGPDKIDPLESMQTTVEESNESKVDEHKQSSKSEESKRKRKLSVESIHSKISLSKLAMFKKIKETKNKIKVPKITFSTSKLKKPVPKKNKNSPPEIKKDIKKPNTQAKNSKPVYIHIPLKPPPGQTDEFSYLEFEEKSDKKPQPVKKLGSFRDVVKNVKQLQETNSGEEQNKVSITALLQVVENIESIPKNENKVDEKSNKERNETYIKEKTTKDPTINQPKIMLQEIISQVPADIPAEKHSIPAEDIFSQNNVISTPVANESMLQPGDESAKDNSLEEILDFTLMEEEDEEKDANEIFDKLFEATVSPSRENDMEVYKPQPVRSKSAEPERRRKLSLESSYSRKSLSKLGILKKLKETTDKIKNSLSRSNSKKHTKPEQLPIKKDVKTPKKLKPEKPVEPVYIHIPLKPVEGQTDEFSYLEFEGKKSLPNDENKGTDGERRASSPDSPVQSDGVQFIMLTAPSDDEILDDQSSDVPETPSSENKSFFGNKIEELKELAKDIVDEISMSSSNKLDTVNEETDIDKISSEEPNNRNEPNDMPAEPLTAQPHIEKEKMMVDEEDGLNESVTKQEVIPNSPPLETKDEVITEQSVEPKIKSNLKDQHSPVIKKKVSFKRRSRTPKDGIYEDIHISKPPTTDNGNAELDKSKTPTLDMTQSMSVDEEKSYLDKKIIKTTSLEEDYNKWSKISDHEYEPVNPPPDNETFPPSSPMVHFIDQEPKYVQPITEIDIISSTVIVNDETRNEIESTNISPALAFTPEIDVSEEATQEPISSTNKNKEGPSKFQLALKQTTEQFKSKFHNMKKPHITMPDKSKFRKFKIEKPKFNFPKIPDTTKVNLPSFNFSRRSSAKRSLKERQLSTESNDGDSKKPIFDFSTYPRIFKKKTKTTGQNKELVPDFATIPRAKGKTKSDLKSETTVKWVDTDSIRIPLHSEESMDIDYGEEQDETCRESQQMADDNREDSVERRMASHIRYEEDIDTEDDYERENQDINKDEYVSRWDHGNFNSEPIDEYLNNYNNSQYKVTDLDSPEDISGQNDDFNINNNNSKETYSSGSSLGMQRIGGVLEEIDSDEFFLRQKGISQDNIEVGMLLSSEIREAFRTPDNSLSKIQNIYGREYDPRGSNQSLPDSQNKRRPIKKPKRKKTPHTSQEQIPYAEESGDDEIDILPPSRPKRRSKRIKKPKSDDIIPYQETISVDVNNSDARFLQHRESLGILGDDEQEIETNITYENEIMQGKQQPEIKITDAYKNFDFVDKKQYDINLNKKDDFEERPAAPPRKHKSLRSLNLSENESISGDINLNKHISEFEMEQNKVNIQSSLPRKFATSEEPPRRPSRMRSRTSSQSVIASQPDEESLSKRTKSLTSENQIPCVEEPCIQDIRDYMGYAIIDKNKVRDPPLPPPRTITRRKRSAKSNTPLASDIKFCTVPRPLNDNDTPIRPLRNYSTLGQIKKIDDTVTYENKENFDITQYIEIDDEPNRDLQSGDVIKKMKDRPLPAPPRPPRKGRPLHDVTSKENIMSEIENDADDKFVLEESEVSTQTEPLPDDLVCEEVIPEVSDTLLSPSKIIKSDNNDLVDNQNINKPQENYFVERRLITPTYYTHEETITHGSLVVEPLDGNKILPDSEITSVSRERIIPITTDSDGETSSISEDFKKLKDSLQEDVKLYQSTDQPMQYNINPEISILKTQKLRVSDLDVDTLTVNKLLAEKIVVSEIDSSNIQTNEISSKSGALKVGEIELPPGIIQQILKSIGLNEEQLSGNEASGFQKDQTAPEESFQEQKKTPINNSLEIEPVQCAHINSDSISDLVDTEHYMDNKIAYDNLQCSKHHTDSLETTNEFQNEPPQPPPRSVYSEDTEEKVEALVAMENRSEYPQRPPRQSEKLKCDSNSNDDTIQEPDIDEEPPPRPPEPQLDYLPSQPPASFYALRAQNYVDTLGDNIPVVPRRRRQPKSKPISRSSSEESDVMPVARRFYNRSSEPSIPQLSGQLVRACGSAANNTLKRLITHITHNVLHNVDGKQDLHVMVIILLVLIAGLILLGYGDEKTVVHLHHWEYFNPPKDM